MPNPSSENIISTCDEPHAGSGLHLNLGAIAVSWLVMLAGVHVMYVAFVLYGSKPKSPSVLMTLTTNGREFYLPERELPIYVLGSALTLAVSLAAAYWWRRVAIQRGKSEPLFADLGCMFIVVLASIASAANIGWLLAGQSLGTLFHISKPILTIALVTPVPVELVLLWDSQRQFPTRIMQHFLRRLHAELTIFKARLDDPVRKFKSAEAGSQASTNTTSRLVDATVVVLICLLLYIPRTDLLAGADFRFQAFHHWDYFAMGPAIGLVKGKALASQVYCQYGIGWPLLLAKLDPFIQLSYGHTYKIAIVYGCVYYCGLYWLFRQLISNPGWALAGVVLALRLQVFHNDITVVPIWVLPSASILRNPCDVWALLLLVAHWRSQNPLWILLAGAIMGLSLLFVIDTGVYLTLTFVAYSLIWLIGPAAVHGGNRRLSARIRWHRCGQFLASLSLGTLVLVGGLYSASGPFVFTRGYVHQWLEVLWLYPSGISMLPMTGSVLGILYSYWFIVMFLGSISAGLLRLCNSSENADTPIVVVTSLLGLFYLMYYIGRSDAYLIFQLSIPFCIVSLWATHSVVTALRVYFPNSRQLSTTFISSSIVSTALVLILISTQFRTYPNLFHEVFRPDPLVVDCYFTEIDDVCAVPRQRSGIAAFRTTVAEMKHMTEHGKSFAIIADDDTSLYVASRSTLWNRYSPLLPPLMTKSMLNDVDAELSKRPVDFVFVLRKDPEVYSSHPVSWRFNHTSDSWAQLFATTRRCYHFDHVCGAYEVWRR